MKNLYTLIIILLSMQTSAAPPTVPASNLNFPAIDGGFFNIGWTPGNGTKRVIICKAGSPVTFIPQNGIDYIENTNFGSGQQVAPGEFVIYDNAFTSFFLVNLTPATQYFFAAFEYNGTGVNIEYLATNFLTGSASTSSVPTQQVSNASFVAVTANSVNATWSNGNGQRRLIVVRAGSEVDADPAMSHQYATNSVFGSGESIGAGNFTVYAGTGNSTSISNLQPNTEYFFSFYEYNGNGQPQYKIPAYTISVTTRSMPTIASSNIIVTKSDGKELVLNWTNGNGQRRIIIAKKNSAVTSQPVNGVDYDANSIFGQGQQLAAGEFIVYDDNFNAATISGLDPATTYSFRIFEYDGTGTNTIYLTTLFATGSGTTAIRPTLQATNIAANNITGNSLNLLLTAGNGRARIVVAHKSTAVNALLQDFIVYTDNSDFGVGQDLGSGNFVISNTTDVVVGVHNLEPNTVYHFAVFEFNGFNQPLYLSPAAIFNVSTLGAVPVTLTNWNVFVSGSKVKLQWTTAKEINSSHFVIERSANGTNFSGIATIATAGNSSAEINYNSEDVDPLTGKSFYRLKMVDKDGHAIYSSIRVIQFEINQAVLISANPVRSVLELSNAAANGKVEWQIITSLGQCIKQGKIAGDNLEINLVTLAAGTYYLRLVGQNKPQVIAFIKQ